MECDTIFTIEEAAERLTVSPWTVRRLMDSGDLGYVLVSARKYRITSEQINAFIELRSVQPGDVRSQA